jgi:hypothetical protein
MKLISSSDIFVHGVPISAGIPFDATDRERRELAFVARLATPEEIAAWEDSDATHAANAAADRRNSGTASLASLGRETAAVSRITKSKAKASR